MTDEIKSSPTEVNQAELAARTDEDIRGDEARRAATESVGGELVHLQMELAAHGLSVAALLRSVAKNAYGVTIAPLEAEPKV